MTATLTTFSGKILDPQRPKPSDIDLLDIAVALSRIPRYVGHTLQPYSVAQHCLFVADMSDLIFYSNKKERAKNRLLALLHDAAEAYTSDIPTPVKHLIPEFKQIEKSIENAIYDHFYLQVSDEEHARIKELDGQAYSVESETLRGPGRDRATFVPKGIMGQEGDASIKSFNHIAADPNLIALLYIKEVRRNLEILNGSDNA